jgi:peptidyl-prolyl cis-trans isomerase D
MFEFVRNHNRILQVLLGLVIFPLFIFSGVQGYSKLLGPDAEEVASVDGKKISKGEWDAQQRQFADRIRRQNPNVDPKLLDTAEARRGTLDEIVRDRVMQAAVFHQDLLVSDDRLVHFIATNPQFQQVLQMDAKTRDAVLRAQGLSEQQMRDYLARQQVLQPVTESAFLPASLQAHALDTVLERRQVQWQKFDPKDYLAKMQPTDAEVQAFYADKKNATLFQAPEQAQIEYVVLDLDALKKQVSVNEDDLKGYYEQNKDKLFGAPAERHVRHILIQVDANATPEAKAQAKAKAEALLAEVRKNPASFGEVAKKSSEDPGTKEQGGELDWFAHDHTMQGPFEDAAFALKQPGDISDLVQTTFGWHIIQLEGVRGGNVKPYEEVRAQIEDTRRRALAQEKFAEVADQFTNMVYEQSDSLQPVVDKFKLQKQVATVQRQAAPGATGPLASQRLLDAVFASDSLRNKRNTEAIETAPNQLVSARVASFQPAHQIPLAEIKDRVVELVREAQARDAARKDGEAKLAEIRKDPAATLANDGIYSRIQRAELPGATLDAALKADLSKGPATTSVTDADGTFVVLRVLKSLPRDPAEKMAPQVQATVARDMSDAESEAFFEALKARYKVKIDEEAVARVLKAANAATAASAASR